MASNKANKIKNDTNLSKEEIDKNKTSTTSVADEIKKLSDLLNESLITEKEFATQKAKILSSLSA